MNDNNQNFRVRIAPSPTGDPHVGTAYIALFNYAFAKKHKGQFILRIEDTDQARSTKESEEMIYHSLKWLGIQYDEGPDIGGPYGPYRQSERKHIYREHIDLLINKDKAYYCFCTSERLTKLREEQKEKKIENSENSKVSKDIKDGKKSESSKSTKIGYDGHCRDLAKEEIEKKLKEKTPYVVRFKMPLDGQTIVHDELRGDVTFDNKVIDDQVLLKSDGFPTYHLASVVDDHSMKITHVIRAEEWISSTPKHVQLYQAFGFDQPKWIHMPLLRNKNKSKISKRKNPVSLLYYEKAGYLPEAMCNFLALMGFSLESEEERFSIEQLIQEISFKRISLGGPVFDLDKLNWLNGLYIRDMAPQKIISHLVNNVFNMDYLQKIIPLVQERLEKIEDFISVADFFFKGSLDYSAVPILPSSREKKETQKVLAGLLDKVDNLREWNLDNIKELMNNYREEIDWKPKEIFMMLRLIVTGRKNSPPLFESIDVLGKELTRRRISESIGFLKTLK